MIHVVVAWKDCMQEIIDGEFMAPPKDGPRYSQ